MREPVRVMLLSQQPGVGGAERLAFSSMAKANDLDVTVVGPPVQCEYARSLGLKALDLELKRIRTPMIGLVRLAAMPLRIKKIAKALKAEVVYANAIRAMGYGLALRLAGGPPLVAHNHHLLAEGDKTRIERGLLDRTRFVRALVRFSDAIVVPSEAAAAAFYDRRKVKVVPNGIDLQHFRSAPDKGRAKRSLGLPQNVAVVGTVTRADPEKGMGPFVEVAKRIGAQNPDCRFLLAGGVSFPHEIDYYETVKSAAAELGDRIVMTGPIHDPLAAFQAMDVMLHLGDLPETFGLTVTEAMACEVPVVGYDWGGIAEVVENGVTGLLISPKDLDAVTGRTLELLRDFSTLRRLGSAGRDRCRRLYDLDRVTRELSDILISVARR
jgi:glycosyltransferase involved in cell wall biosynthesis